MADNYYDYLIDCALVIGANEFSGLIPPQASSKSNEGGYLQQIIAAVSSTVAMFPFSPTSYNYPPEKFRKPDKKKDQNQPKLQLQRQVSQNELDSIHELVSQYNKVEVSEIQAAPNLNRRNSKLRSKRRSMKNITLDSANQSWGSVSMKTMKSFPAIYFKYNIQTSLCYKKPHIQFIPLTDDLGGRSFAIRMEVFRRFRIVANTDTNQDFQGVVRIEPVSEEIGNVSDIIYVPSNIVFFTKFPYFDLFRDILSQLFKRLDNVDTVKFENELLEYCLILTRIPIIKSENLSFNFSINGDIFYTCPAIPMFQEIVDWDITILFQTLSLDDIILVLMAMFQEQKIIFLANDSNLITIITESLFLLFRPFYWKHFYITTTPIHLYELVDAISPFMLGLPHSMKSKIKDHYSELIIVDLQQGNIHIPESCDLQNVSVGLVNKLKQELQGRHWIQSNRYLGSLNPLTLAEFKETYFQFNRNFTQKILTAFMTFMVDIFAEVLENISKEQGADDVIVVTFDKYLKTSHSQNVQFFEKIHRTDNFNCFIDERIRRKINDSWFRIYAQRTPRGTIRSVRARNDSDTQGFSSETFTLIQNEERKQEVIFPSTNTIRGNFYHDVLSRIDKLENTVDIMKLRAEFLMNSGSTMLALEEFNKILEIAPLDLNSAKLRRMIRSLGKNSFEKLLNQRFHFSLFENIQFDIRKPSTFFEPIKIEQFNTPTAPISRDNFLDECRKADIAEHETSINTLFNCLTIDCKTIKNRIKTVHPDIFKCFYNNWINAPVDLNDVEMPSELMEETLIKGTDMSVRVDGYGSGRVILTQYRLCFIPYAKTNSLTIVNFAEDKLKRVKVDIRIRGFGKRSDVLELTLADKEDKVVIWVGMESNVWFQLISEISHVNRLAELDKDKGLIAVMTEHCLMYENMVVCSRTNGFFKNNIVDIGKKILPHIHEKKVAKKVKEDDQRKYIIVKLMPSPKNVVTIDSAIEVCKPYVNNFDIWCACMTRDKYFLRILQILDKKLYKSLEVTIEVPMRVQAMVHLPTANKVALCCMSPLVLLVDTNNHSVDKNIDLKLSTDGYPTCVTGSIHDQRILYFGTNKGEVLYWESQINKVCQIATLLNEDHASSIHVYDPNTLIVGSLYRFYVLNLAGNILNTVVISELSNIMNKVSCLTLLSNNSRLIVGLARLPVLIEYDISDVTNIKCLRKRNILTNKDFSPSEISDHYELSPTYIGSTTVLPIEEDAGGKTLWVMLKDGTIEIREYNTLAKVSKFNAHVDVITKGMLCTIRNHKVVVSVGREDGKVNLWNLNSSQ